VKIDDSYYTYLMICDWVGRKGSELKLKAESADKVRAWEINIAPPAYYTRVRTPRQPTSFPTFLAAAHHDATITLFHLGLNHLPRLSLLPPRAIPHDFCLNLLGSLQHSRKLRVSHTHATPQCILHESEYLRLGKYNVLVSSLCTSHIGFESYAHPAKVGNITKPLANHDTTGSKNPSSSPRAPAAPTSSPTTSSRNSPKLSPTKPACSTSSSNTHRAPCR
jgi:hypothetical protein